MILMLICLKYSDKVILVESDDIYYLTKNGQYVQIRLKDKTIEYRENLYNMSYLLPKDYFMRCHKSFIVNITKILSVNVYNNTTYNVKFRDIHDEIFMARKTINDFYSLLNKIGKERRK